MDTTPDFDFDELVRIGMPTLSAGRVVLLGDSGFCGSPLTGMGTATAIVGAYLLAGEIAAAPDDLAGALARYETLLRPLLAKAQQVPGGGIKAMLPTSRFGVRAGRVAMRAMLSKPMRPVMRRMLTDTEDFALPAYA
jgi:2-polyprenyl-6-methoxyphenol hydroxylase-like FAD-dependent oxidoreductase